MPLVATQITNVTTPCTVQVEIENEAHELVKEPVRLSYYRSRVTRGLGKEMVAMADLDEEQATIKVDEFLLRLVAWWDVKAAEDGPMLPLEPETIRALDPIVKSLLLVGIVKHARGLTPGEASGGKQSSTLSDGTSPAMEKKTASRGNKSQKNMNISRSLNTSTASHPGNGRTPH